MQHPRIDPSGRPLYALTRPASRPRWVLVWRPASGLAEIPAEAYVRTRRPRTPAELALFAGFPPTPSAACLSYGKDVRGWRVARCPWARGAGAKDAQQPIPRFIAAMKMRPQTPGSGQGAKNMSTYTHYTVISRDDSGLIERRSGRHAMARRGITHAEVVSVEAGRVEGWGDATAIGLVQEYLDGRPYGAPLLALLSSATTHVTIHLGSATPHYYDVVRRHRSQETAAAFAAAQNAATRRRYPNARPCYEAVEIDSDGRVYRDGAADLAADGLHRRAR